MKAPAKQEVRYFVEIRRVLKEYVRVSEIIHEYQIGLLEQHFRWEVLYNRYALTVGA